MKKLTDTQQNLLDQLKPLITSNKMTWENIKPLVNCKTFDTSFNALLFKGYIKREENYFFI
jgi:hypothetical protein